MEERGGDSQLKKHLRNSSGNLFFLKPLQQLAQVLFLRCRTGFVKDDIVSERLTSLRIYLFADLNERYSCVTNSDNVPHGRVVRGVISSFI